METLHWKGNELLLLDQTALPLQERYLSCRSWQDVRRAIAVLAVRGAPAIGVAAAYAVVLAARALVQGGVADSAALLTQLHAICLDLDAARPTAVNLHWALAKMERRAAELQAENDPALIADALEALANAICAEDITVNRRLSAYGAACLCKAGKKLNILTHCNAGALATAGIGTALGVIRASHARGLVNMVYADETRPLLQGARLTATELHADGIPVTLITDNMAAWVMRTKEIDAVIVGADRITGNGDTANKIGTYGVAILAREHRIPFYVAAPISTFDLQMETGVSIPIEERDHQEVRQFQGQASAPADVAVFNPAFDVTPHEYITAIFTEAGVISEPDARQVTQFFQKKGVVL
ncbi:S-methyl-5-thioribose-1-phosphate isomerase [Megasphaera vaginalis (ex Bordigoni et al. 2020)]|uniref:S-methyl-5-thioribose-1-phosphate isomerase n=1 Tax=Megasphaera vaginalis (ex Bordigoni et al. 2020) TaxID=2045301 RepID=UPI000C7AAD28|nr:S-methyl-5-thioribose-1-phosphate isomerase [Megasphaera vaginalis (ex Bordigoni et al. 2020)]